MKNFTYLDPLGNLHQNPSIEQLRKYVFEEGDNYWQTGSAEATLRFFDNEQKKSVVYLSGIEDYGFKVEQEYKGKNEDIYTLKKGARTGKIVVMMNPAGEDGYYFQEYFVPKEIAWQAVEHFLKTGERDPSLTWEIAEVVETV